MTIYRSSSDIEVLYGTGMVNMLLTLSSGCIYIYMLQSVYAVPAINSVHINTKCLAMRIAIPFHL